MSVATRHWTIWITRTADVEARRIYHYLCDCHTPLEGGTIAPSDEPSARVVSARSRPMTATELDSYGDDECDVCCGDVAFAGTPGMTTPTEEP